MFFASTLFLFAFPASGEEASNRAEELNNENLAPQDFEAALAPLQNPAAPSFSTSFSTLQTEPDLFIPTDTTWKSSDNLHEGWNEINYDDSSWPQAINTNHYTYIPPWPGTIAIKSPSWHYRTSPLAYFRKTFELTEPLSNIKDAKIRIAVDDDFDLYLNENLIASDWDHYVHREGKYYDLKPFLQQGKNVLAIKAQDYWCCHHSIVASVEIYFGQAQALEPVILIPGILGSKNLNVLLLDKEEGEWSFTSHHYDSLIAALKAAGFEEGKTLFIGHYDWRQPNEDSAKEYLKPLIEKAKQESGSSKVNLITHSMGGPRCPKLHSRK